MAVVELAQPIQRTPGRMTWEELPDGRWAITGTAAAENLGLPVLTPGYVEKYQTSDTSGAAFYFPRAGSVRVYARALTSQGWSDWQG